MPVEPRKESRHVLLGVTGCIGVYKAVEILRGLQQAGVTVQVVMTRHATEFVQPLTFEALSGRPVVVGMYERPDYAVIEHIALAREAQLLLVAPATANVLAKFAQGLADDFLSTLYLSNTNPVLVAPAMNVEMWHHPATRENLSRACGRVGSRSSSRARDTRPAGRWGWVASPSRLRLSPGRCRCWPRRERGNDRTSRVRTCW